MSPSERRPVLQVRGLCRAYGDIVAIDGVDLDVDAGECVALLGRNGAGKTTLLRVAAGRLEPTEGSVAVGDDDVHDRRRRSAVAARVAFVPDSPVLYDDLTVAEHLTLVGLAHGVAADDTGSLVLFVAGSWLAAAGLGDAALMGVGVLVAYWGVSRLVEPLRVEGDRPEAHNMLPWGWGGITLRHCVVPLALATASGLVILVPAVATGTLAGAGPFVLLLPLVAGVLVACAAIAAGRGPFPVEVLVLGGDAGIMFLGIWLTVGPQLAVLGLAVPLLLLSQGATGALPAGQATAVAALVLGATLSAAVSYLRRRRAPGE